MEKNYERFGTEWRKHMNRFTKSDLISLLRREIIRQEALFEISKYREECRHYLMANNPNDITIEETLQKLGYNKNGL